MSRSNLRPLPRRVATTARLLAATALALAVAGVDAQSTDISNVPLANSGSTVIAKPNVMFILDDSGSMASPAMPDEVNDDTSYGFRSAQCNGVAFDPDYPYRTPVRADGSLYPDADFNAAWPDGYNPTPNPAFDSGSSLTLSSGAKTVNITGVFLNAPDVGDRVVLVSTADSSVWMMGTVTSVDFTGLGQRRLGVNVDRVSGSGQRSSWSVGRTTLVDLNNSRYYTYRGAQPRLAWRYTSSGVVADTFYDECLSTEGTAPGSGVFTRVNVTNASPAALRQNYANWYSYYRTRLLTMRTAAGRAFSALDGNYRVGFNSINDNSPWLNVDDFAGNQRITFYSRLYSTRANGGTPLRAALARAGQYYANKMSGQTADPVQFACQRNYAILSTDGYWNDAANPKRLDGTDIGQQDAADVRPMSDGGSATSTTVVTTTTVTRRTTPGTVTQTESRTAYAYTPFASGCSGLTRRTATPQTRSRSAAGSEQVDLTETTVVTTVTSTVAGVSTTSTSTSGPTTTTGTPVRTTPTGTYGAWVNGSPVTECGAYGLFPPDYSATQTATSFAATGAASTAPVSSSTTTSGPTVVTTGGASNTLADVAWYYYATDLRTDDLNNCSANGRNVCANETPSLLSERDTLGTQRMITYTLGMGVNGTLAYDPLYLTAATGTYAQLKSGTLDWPAPQRNQATAVDDLWHAAVNGRGRYFSARNADEVAAAISDALSDLPPMGIVGSGSATSSRTLPTDGSGRIYETSYNANDWSGDLRAYALDRNGNKTGASLWSAAGGVDALAQRGGRATDGRTIYYMQPTAGGATLRPFTYAQLTTDGRQAAFDNFCTQATVPAQCAGLSTANRALANNGANLVAWLRGASIYETTNTTSPLYRARSTTLGDIVGATPAFLSRPPFNYADPGYAAFKSAQASRKLVVYVAANDGMLHAFSAAGADAGQELWAFVPSAVMGQMYRLADTAYPDNHRYFVDATPEIGDIWDGSRWRTILVGGLGAGGRAYYALDITDPLNPQALWEYTDDDLGLTYGNPVIAKRADGTWIVAFASGYNNVNPGTGNGFLYVLNARTGVRLLKLATSAGGADAGDTTTPSGLAKLAAWVDSERDNTVKRLYGGDLRGNLWRFDIDASTNRVTRLAQMLVGGTPQPITARPAVAQVTYGTGSYPVVYVATGRYLGSNDLTDTTQQSIYAIKDPMDGSSWDNVRTSADFVTQTLTTSGSTRTITSNPVDWGTQGGWRVDLPSSRERVFVDLQLAGRALVVASAIPGTNSLCRSTGGTSWLYLFDAGTGSAVPGRSAVGVAYPGGVLMGTTVNYAADGSPVISARGSDGGTLGPQTCTECKPAGGSSGTLRRTYWRELVN